MPGINELQQKIQKKNILALLLIALLVSISYFALMYLSKEQEDVAYTIDIAGSQRMYSQKIALYATRYHRAINAGLIDRETKERLITAANNLKKNHLYLTQLVKNNPTNYSNSISNIYFDNPINLDNKVHIYINAANQLTEIENPELTYQLLKKQFDANLVEQLLKDLNNVVLLLVKDSKDKVIQLKTFEGIIWFCVITLLVIIYFVVFDPMQKLISKAYQDLLVSNNLNDEVNFAINKHAIVYRLNMKGQITYINDRFTELYRYEKDEIINRNVFRICGDIYTQKDYEEIFKVCVSEEYWHGESLNKIKGGRQLWVNTTIVPLKNLKKRIDSFIVIQNDISGIKQTELALNQLHHITSDVDKDINEKIHQLLALGKQLFNLPFAIVSEVKGSEYTVLHCHTPENEINPGDTFEIENTYCVHTLAAQKPISFHQASKSSIKNHPCFQAFGLESYIGVPLIVDGEVYGTLNFSGPDISPKPFSERELDLIQLFANWLCSELMRFKHQKDIFSQQALLEQMGQQARIGAWEVDLVNEKIYWSKVVKEIHQVPDIYEPDLTTAINFYKEGESRNTIQQLVNESIEKGTPYDTELQLITYRGNEIWVAARGRSEFKEGKCIRLYGSFQDITERKLAEDYIKNNNQRMNLAADSAGIGVWELDLIDNSLKWDDWMFKLYGVNADEFSGAYEAWENGLHPEDKEASATLLAQAVKGEKKFDTQFRIIWRTGEIKYIRAAAIVTKAPDGTPVSMVGVNYDVTEQIENEQALTKAKTLAESAVTAKNEFLASMSHEIRTPMNGVIGMLALLNDSELTHEQEHRISIAKESANSLLTLINDILDFSKIDANKLELEHIPFNLSDMSGNFALAMAQQAQNKGLELILDIAGIDESEVIGDQNRLRQIMTNLVGNAIKFTETGEIIIRLDLQSHSKNEWLLTIDVIDNGIGISKSQQENLFSAFTQVDASTTRKYGGTGLGLAIVKKLCERMGGTIALNNKVKQGSHFIGTVVLEKSPSSHSLKPKEKANNNNVLIIDNNSAHIAVLTKQLNSWDYNVESVMKTDDVVLLCREKAANNIFFNLILVNHELIATEKTTLEQALKGSVNYKDTSIVIMAPMSVNISPDQLQELGATKLFSKPMTHDTLRKAVMLSVNNSQQLENKDTSTEKSPNDETDLIEYQWHAKTNILLVEDNRVNQMVAKGVLKKMGLTCDVAVDGKGAIEQLIHSHEDKPYTFIFMDCQMPIMDGYQATKAIRAGSAGNRYTSVPIVAMTANAMVGDREKCLEAGMNDYITKPINKDRISGILLDFIGENAEIS